MSTGLFQHITAGSSMEQVTSTEAAVFSIEQTFCDIEGTEFRTEDCDEALHHETYDDETITEASQTCDNSDNMDNMEFEEQHDGYFIAENGNGSSAAEDDSETQLQMQLQDDDETQLEIQLRNAAVNQPERSQGDSPEKGDSDPETNMHWGFLKVELAEGDRNIKFVQNSESDTQEDPYVSFLNDVVCEKTLVFMCEQDLCDYHTYYLDVFKRHISEAHGLNFDKGTIFKKFVCSKNTYRYKTEQMTEFEKCPNCNLKTFRRHRGNNSEHNYCSELHQCTNCEYRARRKTVWVKNSKCKYNQVGTHFKCYKCGYKNKMKRFLRLHYKKAHRKLTEIHQCDQCHFRTESLAEMVEHFKNKMTIDVSVLECSYRGCTYKTLQKKLLMIHFANHYYDSWYKCTFCHFKSGIVERLSRHYICFHRIDSTYYECYRQCGYKTKFRVEFIEHCRDVHNELAEWNECKICGAEFEVLDELQEHMEEEHWAQEKI